MHRISRATGLALLALVPLACDSGTDPGPTPASLDLTIDPEAIFIDENAQVTATVRDDQDQVITDADVTFESEDEDVATVSAEGVVTGVGEGETDIVATAGNATDFVTIFVFDPEGPCFQGFPIEVPGSVQGTLEEGDCDQFLEDGSFFDIWFFELDAETDVTITLSSDDFDAYLFLEDEEFNVIANNDDGGPGTDAQISRTLSAGLYWVLANHYPPEAGDYTITIETGGTSLMAPDGAPTRHAEPRTRAGVTRLHRR